MSEIKATELQAKKVELAKQWAMYVDLVDGEVFTPSQAFSRKSAFEVLKLAEDHLQYHLKFKPTDEELEAFLSLKAKMKEGEDFIGYFKRTHSKNINKE